jgi:hypothetical protein
VPEGRCVAVTPEAPYHTYLLTNSRSFCVIMSGNHRRRTAVTVTSRLHLTPASLALTQPSTCVVPLRAKVCVLTQLLKEVLSALKSLSLKLRNYVILQQQ